MDILQIPYIVRISWFNGNLEDTVKRFRSDFVRIPGIFPELNKFLTYEPGEIQYLILASHNTQSIFKKEDYNFALTIASESKDYNERILSDFESKTKITGLREPSSPGLKYKLGTIAQTLPFFKRVGLANISIAINGIFR